jgi:uncharacterized membrane protein (UPF0127 family)
MSNISRRIFLAYLGILLASISANATAQLIKKFRKSNVTIISSGQIFTFNIELAEDSKQHALGLMYRQKLAPDAGMLFDYKTPHRISMWMKNTFIPLDMIFIAADGRIVNIAERTIPKSTTVISSHENVKAVLEVNSGTVAKLGIKPGDLVRHRIFE